MTLFELFTLAMCGGAAAGLWQAGREINRIFQQIHQLKMAVVQLQGVAQNQLAINAKTSEMQSILESVNNSLLKIVEGEKT